MSDIKKKFKRIIRKNVRTCAIILAAGESSRMGMTTKKPFLLLGGMPVLARTLLAFQNCRNIDEIIVVASRGDEMTCLNICKEYGITKLLRVVTGGATRQKSAMIGLEAVPKKAVYVAIHDGARPLITPMQITDVIFAAQRYRVASAGVISKDSVKLAREKEPSVVDKTLDRKLIWLVQTPQVFYKTLYEAVAYSAERDGVTATDDASLAEYYGYPVHMVDTSHKNIKITFPFDISIAEAILSKDIDEYGGTGK